ncbi:LADA_0B07162g1_1 [Lachancea dasiensis]|uniref:LADA_0B07162g1_1 n=1 Tax=Lachancea dasiensis TaxID=1072105 RepID=A0A1G4IU92_9SACH|nr:LADA_0B07162g1_1 [Lachancea dasiensis]
MTVQPSSSTSSPKNSVGSLEHPRGDTNEALSKRKYFSNWLQNLKEHSPSEETNDEESVFIDVGDACFSSTNPFSYIPVLSATEAQQLLVPPQQQQSRNHPHGRRLKAFLRSHLRRPSRRRLLSPNPRSKFLLKGDGDFGYGTRANDFVDLPMKDKSEADVTGDASNLDTSLVSIERGSQTGELKILKNGVKDGKGTLRLSNPEAEFMRQTEAPIAVKSGAQNDSEYDSGTSEDNTANCNLNAQNDIDDYDPSLFKREDSTSLGVARVGVDGLDESPSSSNREFHSHDDSKLDSLKRTSEGMSGVLAGMKRARIEKEESRAITSSVKEIFDSARDSSSVYSETPSLEPYSEKARLVPGNDAQMVNNPYLDESNISDFRGSESPRAVTIKDAREPSTYRDSPKVRTPTFTPLSKSCKLNTTPTNASPLEEKLHGMMRKFKAVVQPPSEAVDNHSCGEGMNDIVDTHCSNDTSIHTYNRNGSRTNSVQRRQAFKPSKSEEFETQRLCVPTFRQSLRKIDALGLFEDVRKGTMTERDLFNLSKLRPDDSFDFRDERFYDRQLCFSGSSNSSKSGGDDFISASVKFNKFSQLLMYDVRKTSKFDDLEPSSHPGSSQETTLLRGAPTAHKPILKRRTNERASEESLRAEDCDNVDATEFIKFFEGHEARRRVEEARLSKIRDRQLTNYYANDHMYNSIRNGDRKSATIDFRKSRKATEANIGRELRDPNQGIISSPNEFKWQRLHKENPISQQCC